MRRSDALTQLVESQPLSLISISEPILKATQSSGAGQLDPENATASSPAALSADLIHYQELFSKLRFSYVEQVTKERFLRAITREPPEFVSNSEIAEIESRLKLDKENLAQKKLDVRAIIEALEDQGRQSADRYIRIQTQKAYLEEFPHKISEVTANIATLERQQDPETADAEYSLNLEQTKELTAQKEHESHAVEVELRKLQEMLLEKQSAVARINDDLRPLILRRNKAEEEAAEARRSRHSGGMTDELEEKGRWTKGSQIALKALLDV